MVDFEIIWLTEQRRYAFLVSRGAYYSAVSYSNDPEESDVFLVSNDEYVFWEERAIEYEPDDDGC